jgi:sterol desaturase/sphingolipid hydroxylase (fatty acid hydroxylase superfamily)
MFGNQLLEALTRTHFAVPVIMYYAVGIAFLTYAALYTDLNMWHALYMVPVGLMVFTFVEYLIHRFLFHFEAKSESQKKIKYNIHGVHHEYPKDKDRLVMPPVMSIGLAVAFYFLFDVMMGEYALFFFPGFLAGYSTYLLIHYAVHRYRPPRNFLGYLWKHHSLHHYKSENTAYSVSFPLWDILFGTMPFKGKQRDKGAENKLPDYHSKVA